MSHTPPAIVGTRGQFATAHHENVIPSLNLAPAWADGIYVNIRRTSDGVPVLMHDSTVDRTTNGTGAVDSLTLSQIQALDAGDGAQVPTLAEYLQAVLDLEAAQPGRRPLSRLFLNPRVFTVADIASIHTAANDAAFASITGRYAWIFGDIHTQPGNLTGAQNMRAEDPGASIGTWFSPPISDLGAAITTLATVDGDTLLLGPRNVYWPQPGLLATVQAAGLVTGVTRVSGFIRALLPVLYADQRAAVVWCRDVDTLPYWNVDGTAATGAAHLTRATPSHVTGL